MNTKKHTAGKVILIVLIVLVSLFDLFWLIGIIGIAMEQNDVNRIDTDYITYSKLTGTPYLEKIGAEYEGNADAGYTYYRIHIPVVSLGTQELSVDYDLHVNVEGEDYSDVSRYYGSYGDEQEDMFTYTNVEILPPGQQGEMTEIVQIKDGVQTIFLTFYPTSDDYYSETNGQEIQMQVP